jgi:hypothetical protein
LDLVFLQACGIDALDALTGPLDYEGLVLSPEDVASLLDDVRD